MKQKREFSCKINFSLYLAVFLSIEMAACTGPKQEEQNLSAEEDVAVRLTADGVAATSPYITYDQDGNPVLCWTESLSELEGDIMKYAIFNTSTNRFSEAVTVLPSRGTHAHPESMNKVAFKADGTVVAIYAIKHPTSENRFAGSLFYTLSTNGGETWTEAAYLHSDTFPGYGRGYFDLSTLPDGEVGAVWLDGRFSGEGSAIYFARTDTGKGFGADHAIAEGTCQCCRTIISTDHNGRVHVAFRGIDFLNPGKQVRDISYTYSDNLGSTFDKVNILSGDNWAIEGCPHTGPSLAADEKGLHALWFTEGGGAGIYYTHSADFGDGFSPRRLISKKGRNPQLISLSKGKLGMVWNEATASTDQKPAASESHHHGGGHMSSSSSTKIILQLRDGEEIKQNRIISDNADGHATHPVIGLGNGNLLVAWTQTEGEHTGIYYKTIVVE